jgi:hypothetical protein
VRFRSRAVVARDALGVDEWLSTTYEMGGADKPMRMTCRQRSLRHASAQQDPFGGEQMSGMSSEGNEG